MENDRLSNEVKIKKALDYVKRSNSSLLPSDLDISRTVVQALERQMPYKLTNQNKKENTGMCKCQKIIRISVNESCCKYCGQRILSL